MAIITPEFPNPVPIEGVILPIALELGDGDFLGLPDEQDFDDIEREELGFFDELSEEDEEDYIPDDETEETLEYGGEDEEDYISEDETEDEPEDDYILSDANLRETVEYDENRYNWDLPRELDHQEILYANNIMNDQPGRASFEKWLRITLVLSPHSNNRYNLDRTTQEIVQIILINQVWGFWGDRDPLMIMCRELMRQNDWGLNDLIQEYSMAYNVCKAYIEGEILEV